MRKMNKIVALSLVLAMALSMMASAASFKDQATINAELVDDINMMVALNVFSADGTGAGNFEPNTVLTRAQVAKMVYVLKNKGVDNGATSWAGLNIFTDVEAGAWYEGYVNYCASVGMIAGVGDNTFMPNKEITAVEFAKLLLVLNGYKADVEGYVGDKWFENIVADAEEAGIFEGYELPVKGNVTREWAALLLNNAINVTMVKYSDGEAVEQFVTTVNPNTNATLSYPVTFKTQQLGLVENEGILVETPNVKLGSTPENNTDGKNVYSKIDTDDNGTADLIFKAEVSPELLGQKVVVTTKGNLAANSNNSDVKVYGVVAHEDVTAVDTTIDALAYTAIDSTENDATTHAIVTVGGVAKKIALTDTIDVYVDYTLISGQNGSAWGTAPQNATTSSSAAIFDGAKAGQRDDRAIKMIDNNNDGIWDKAMIEDVIFGEVVKHKPAKTTIRIEDASNSVIFNTSSSSEYAEVNFIDTVEEEDIVKVTYDFSTGSKIMNVELAETVTGVVSSVSGSTVTIDGETIKTAAGSIAMNATVTPDSDEQVLYTTGKYVVKAAFVTSNADQSNIAYVIRHGVVANGLSNVDSVDILKNDGTRETIAYKNVSGEIQWNAVDNGTYDNKIVEYVMSDGKVYFKALADVAGGDIDVTTAAQGLQIDISEDEATDGTSTWLTNEDTYFFVVAHDNGSTDYAVVTVDELLGDVTGNTQNIDLTMGVAKEGLPYVKYAVLDITGDLPTAESSQNVIAIASDTVGSKLDADGNTIWTLSVTKLDGTTVVLETNDRTDFATFANNAWTNNFNNMFVKYSVDTDGLVDSIVSHNNGNTGVWYGFTRGTLTAVDEDIVVIDNTVKYLADDVKMYFVDTYQNASGVTYTKVVTGETELVVADKNINDQTITGGVFVKYNGTSGEIEEIVCEIDGEYIAGNNQIGQ